MSDTKKLWHNTLPARRAAVSNQRIMHHPYQATAMFFDQKLEMFGGVTKKINGLHLS
jgi:hypothetical protein